MSLEFELPLFSFIFILILNIAYFSKKRISLIENKCYEGILKLSLFFTIMDTVAHLICSVYPYEIIVSDFYTFFNCLNKLIIVLMCLIFGLLFIYTLFISYESLRENHKRVFLPFIIGTIMIVITILFTDIEIISIGEVTNVRGTTVILGYIYVILLLLSTLIASLINIKQIDKRYMVVFLITLAMGALLVVTAIVPGILIYSVCLALLCYIMFFTIENPDVEMIKQLNIAKSEAERANMAKSDFLSSMSHEIRTPLNAIVGLSEDIFGSNELPESLKEDCEDILTASNILQELIGNIIDFNKIENQKLTMSLVNYNLIKEIDSLVRINSTRIGTKNIKINTTYADDLPYELYGDKIHMKQIINNLLSNAVKYTDEGSIDVNVKCTNRGKTSILQISVKDTGKGIKPEDINKLFDKFERLDIQKTSTIEGSGLGLAITKYLVERMEGRINVQSDYGKGSSFVVTIPQAIHVFEKPVDAPVVTNVVDPTKFYNKKLLIVDDNTLNIKVAKKALKDFKFIIDECSNGVECLEKIKTNTYDLILLDIMMPVMDGKEVIKKLKANPEFKTPVIALTADAVSEAKEKYIKMGFNEYIAKPFNKEKIKIKLNDIFK